MKNIAIYPGSFNPYHIGHEFVVQTALKVFDDVLICRLQNHSKREQERTYTSSKKRIINDYSSSYSIFDVLGEITGSLLLGNNKFCLIRGIRNGGDLQNELAFQYEVQKRTGIPTFNIITSPELSHISSSSIRELARVNQDVSEYLA